MSASATATPAASTTAAPAPAASPAASAQTPNFALTATQLLAVMSHAPIAYLQPLNAAMRKFQINTARRVAAFLGQIAEESNELRHTMEGWSKKKNFKLPNVHRPAFTAKTEKEYFEHWYGKRAGNDTMEDGYTYRGRGIIQITGRPIYTAVGKGIGQPLVDDPDLVATDMAVDCQAACFYFNGVAHGTLSIADRVNPASPQSVYNANYRISQLVNGVTKHKPNGLEVRLMYYKKALRAFGLMPPAHASHPKHPAHKSAHSGHPAHAATQPAIKLP